MRIFSYMIIVPVIAVSFCFCSSRSGSIDDSGELSIYGGSKKLSGSRTGFFHTEQINDRWWIIDPDGYVFISLGLNHVTSGVLLYDYNREENIKRL